MNMKLATWVLAGLCSAAPVLGNDWYQWRGPEQDGVSREKNLPEKWSPDGENLAWSAKVGHTYLGTLPGEGYERTFVVRQK